MNVIVLCESWQPHPLVWIHRAEARFFAEELRRAGYAARLVRFRDDSISDLSSGLLVLRLSDPVMLAAVQTLTRAAIPFLGPSAAAMERCYDKYEAYRVATAHGVDCPATALASEASMTSIPMLLKPRRGSDSIGVRLLRDGRIPARARTDRYITQQYVRGVELTVAVFRERAGMPLAFFCPRERLILSSANICGQRRARRSLTSASPSGCAVRHWRLPRSSGLTGRHALT
jgi:hypothetical protein